MTMPPDPPDPFDDAQDPEQRPGQDPADDQRGPDRVDRGGGYYRVQRPQVTALLPEHIGEGAFATSVIILQNRGEFVLDFIQNVARPHRITARVVLPAAVTPQVITALRQAVEGYRERIGPFPEAPKPAPPPEPPPIQDVYNELKVSDAVRCGAYANSVLINHNPVGWRLDFIAGFFPRPVVTARVLMAAQHVPPLLQSLEQSWNRRKDRR